ncbi:MAG: GNAT family N-acetyltransferase, partial [Gammaproteobacteria bacterium]
MHDSPLKKLFRPQSIAIIGATDTPGSVGRQVLNNIVQGGFTGAIYPVNAKYDTLAERPCFKSIRDIEHAIDLAIIVIPSRSIPQVLRDCGEKNVGSVMVLSAGFGEISKMGQALQNQIVDIARQYEMPLIGPNCLGIMRPCQKLNATFTRNTAKPGHIALIAQSSSICTATLDWADANGFGFSAVVSMGAMADVGLGDMLDYFANDPKTHSIMLYIEGIPNAREFMSSLRVAARLKPVIVVKPGNRNNETRAHNSHFGAQPDDDAVLDAALGRAGAVRVSTIDQMFAAARVLASNKRIHGRRLAILTNGGGPGAMAADRAARLDVELASLSEETISKLSAALPAHWSHSNPIDILGDADGERYEQTLSLLLADPNTDSVLVLLAPQGLTDPTECAQGVINAAKNSKKPVLTSWIGRNLVMEGRKLLNEAGIPHFVNPEESVNAFSYLANYQRNQRALMQTPQPMSQWRRPDVEGAKLILENALAERRSRLTNTEGRAILRSFRIPTNSAINITSAADALVAAETVGLPVVMKINSPDIDDKSGAGGVKLNVQEPRSVRTAYKDIMQSVQSKCPDANILGVCVEPMVKKPGARELIIAVQRDPVFGPVISLGIGGTAADIIEDRRIALPPLNDYLCRQLINSNNRVRNYLSDFSSLLPAKVDALVYVLQRVSEMACELPHIAALRINPLWVDEHEAIALDTTIAVAPPQTTTRRYGHMAIHPYPFELENTINLPNGSDIIIRPIQPEDAEAVQLMMENLSEESRYFRFMYRISSLTTPMLVRFTQIDYDREMALVAVSQDNVNGESNILG